MVLLLFSIPGQKQKKQLGISTVPALIKWERSGCLARVTKLMKSTKNMMGMEVITTISAVENEQFE